MAQFNNIDSNRPQRLLIQWHALHERDSHAGAPDSNDDGFWPSLDPNAAGYVAPENFEREQRKAKRRMADWRAGRWHYIGIRARAVLHIPIGGSSFRILTLESSGLWGIESNSGKAYLAEVYAEERRELMKELATLGAALASGEYDETEAATLCED